MVLLFHLVYVASLDSVQCLCVGATREPGWDWNHPLDLHHRAQQMLPGMSGIICLGENKRKRHLTVAGKIALN